MAALAVDEKASSVGDGNGQRRDSRLKDVHYEMVDVEGVESGEVVYTDAEEKSVRRKLDFWIMPILMISYGLQYWDKALLGQAVLFNLQTDLGLVEIIGHDSKGAPITDNTKYSNCSWIFYIGYMIAAYPIALLAQRYPTAKVCAFFIILWSIVVLTTPACKNYAGLMLNRFFLGMTEACIAPVFTVYITFWWTRQEQSLRSSLWLGMTGVGTIISPLISYGIGHIKGPFGASTWKYMFLIAGSITFLWGFVVLFVMPDNPLRTKWLKEHERSIVVARLKENNAGLLERRFKVSHVWEAARDYNMWSNAFVVLITGIPSSIFATFASLVIHGLGFDVFNSLLLTLPLGAVALLAVYGAGYITRRWMNLRFITMFCCCLPALAGGLICWKGPRDKPGLLYAGVCLLPFVVGANALGVGLSSSNVAGHTKKSTVSAATFVGYCVGNMLGPVCFASTPGPIYQGGFIACTVATAAVMVISVVSRFVLSRENARRDREYGPPSKEHALEDLTDRENMNFRYMI